MPPTYVRLNFVAVAVAVATTTANSKVFCTGCKYSALLIT
jgi:hypothetical protein